MKEVTKMYPAQIESGYWDASGTNLKLAEFLLLIEIHKKGLFSDTYYYKTIQHSEKI